MNNLDVATVQFHKPNEVIMHSQAQPSTAKHSQSEGLMAHDKDRIV